MRRLQIFTLFILFHFHVQGQESQSPIHIGIIADIQYADRDDRGTRYYKASLQKLDTAVTFLNRHRVACTVVFGDLVDQGIKDLPPITRRLGQLQAPVYNILGNHDYEDARDKNILYTHYNMIAPYYTFDKGNWRLIILNTNELSEYATNPGTSLYEEWKTINDQLKEEGRKNARPWNGGIGKKQISWMEEQLKKATLEAKNVLVLTHHPLFPENGLEALNNREILKLIIQYSCVRAVISGHHHEGNYAYYKKIPIVTLEGMVETAGHNAFGVMSLHEDKIEISGQGRLTSRVLNF
mgnify:CR=1 FL=1